MKTERTCALLKGGQEAESGQRPLLLPGPVPEISPEVRELVEGRKERVRLSLEYENPFQVEMASFLKAKVLGQESHLDRIAKLLAARFSRRGERKGPLAVVYLAGPTGVGKTETAHALAEFFLKDPEAFTKIHGEDLQDHHTGRNLFGSAKMYVGYRDPTPLNDVRLYAPLKEAQENGKIHPSVAKSEKFSIVLIDEADKVAQGTLQNFLGIFDKGKFEFPTGSEDDDDIPFSKVTDFRETVFILTSNAGEHEKRMKLSKGSIGFMNAGDERKLRAEEIVKQAMREKFSPEFIERVDLVLDYDPISEETAEGIVRKSLEEFKASIARRFGRNVSIDVRPETVRSAVVAGLDPEKGGRNLRRNAETGLFEPIEGIFLSGKMLGFPKDATATIRISGDVGNLEATIENYQASQYRPERMEEDEEGHEETEFMRILDAAKKIQAYERVYAFAFRENFTPTSEITRLEEELVAAGIPEEELDKIRDRVVDMIDRELKGGDEKGDTFGTPLPDARELFYPISPEAIVQTVRHFVKHSEKGLSRVELSDFRDRIVFWQVKKACSELVGGELTKDQHDYVNQTFHHLYLMSLAKQRK